MGSGAVPPRAAFARALGCGSLGCHVGKSPHVPDPRRPAGVRPGVKSAPRDGAGASGHDAAQPRRSHRLRAAPRSARAARARGRAPRRRSDGTLVEIAERPDAVTVPGEVRGLLSDLHARTDGAAGVGSGRHRRASPPLDAPVKAAGRHSIKVGEGETAADRQLAGPAEVREVPARRRCLDGLGPGGAARARHLTPCGARRLPLRDAPTGD